MNWYRKAIVPILLAAFVFAFSIFALWLGDDIFFSLSIADGSWITSFRQVIPSQIAHYKLINGRIPAHFLCQLYLPFFGKTAFAISNALVYVALLLMMASLGSVRFDDWKKMGMLACLILLGFRTKFTPTCQIGFPWMFALVAAFLLILERFGRDHPRRWKVWHLMWVIPFSFIAGWSQEALVIGVGVALAVRVMRHFKQVTVSQWGMLFAFTAGAAMLCLAPSAIGRVNETHSDSDLLPPILLSLAKLGFYLRVSYLLLAWVLYLLISKRCTVRRLLSSAGFYWIVWAVMLLFNLLIGVFGNRQLFGMEFAAILIIFKSAKDLRLFEKPESRLAENVILAALSLCVLVIGIENTRFLKHHRAVYHYIESAYKTSDDGVVYYDFSAADVTARDTYPSDPFTWHSLETLSWKFGAPALRVIPGICAQLDRAGLENHWENIAKGAITVVLNKDNPTEQVAIHRSLFSKRLSDAILDTSQPIYENDCYKVFLLYEKLPFVKNVDVSFTNQ